MINIVTVVLNYKTPDLSVKAAQSAAAAMADFGGVIVLVDNASPDDSFHQMQQAVRAARWPAHIDVQVLQSGRNGGFGAGNNFGIRAGLDICPDAEFVYILNPDASVEKDGIAALVSYLEANPRAAIAGSRISGEDGAAHCSAFRFPGLASEFEAAARLGPVTRLLKDYVLPLHVPATSSAVGWIVGASMLARTSVLNKIGLFDETFFLYFEETDLCLRARRAGHEVHFVRESRICHIGSVSTGMGCWTRTPPYWFQSRWYYYSKNYNRAYAISATLLNAVGTVCWRLRRWAEGKPDTDAEHFVRDLLSHDLRALCQPTPEASIRAIGMRPDTPLQISVD